MCTSIAVTSAPLRWSSDASADLAVPSPANATRMRALFGALPPEPPTSAQPTSAPASSDAPPPPPPPSAAPSSPLPSPPFPSAGAALLSRRCVAPSAVLRTLSHP
eukprot:4779773-Pleurochrysis_carterae.AAC.1